MKITSRICRVSLSVFILISLISVPVRAVSLGTLQKNDFVNLEIGRTAELTILFWNLENSSQEIRLEPKAPEDLIVIVQPKEFVLNQSNFGPPYSGEYVHLPIGDVEAFLVKILVKSTETLKEGMYEMSVSAKTTNSYSGVNFAQEKIFHFKINVTSLISTQEEGESFDQNISSIPDKTKDFTGKIELPQINLYYTFLALVVALILLASFLIYKFF